MREVNSMPKAAWSEFWGLIADPFHMYPLTVQNFLDRPNLLVRTRAISLMDESIEVWRRSPVPRSTALYGRRGIGKTTLLNYVEHLLNQNLSEWRILPIGAKLLSPSPDPDSLLGSLFFSLMDSLSYNRHLSEPMRERSRKFLIGRDWEPRFDLSRLAVHFTDLISSITSHGEKVVLLVDEFDKIPRDVVADFLKGFQGTWERLSSRDVSWVFSLGPLEEPFTDYAWSDGYQLIDNFIPLHSWNKDEVAELIERHLRAVRPRTCLSDYFDHGAISLLTRTSGGIPRNAMRLAEELLILAAQQKKRPIDEQLVRELVIERWPIGMLTTGAQDELSKASLVFREKVVDLARRFATLKGHSMITLQDVEDAVEQIKKRGS